MLDRPSKQARTRKRQTNQTVDEWISETYGSRTVTVKPVQRFPAKTAITVSRKSLQNTINN